MQPKRNYFLEQQKILQQTDSQNPPKLLLHSCCAPCSSAVLEYLSQYLSITVFYYNPNIFPEAEFLHRIDEQKRLIEQLPVKNKISFIERGWHPDRFYDAIKGLEHIREGGERCFACYRLRLEESAKLAAELGCDYFTTTLSISPYKNAPKLNEIGDELAEKYGVKHLPSDFKKKNGYKRSVELSAEYGLYRQDYCGCIFSKKEREESLNEKAT
ncbi:MAG: epoxyqueuosine reductase QueH [Oscillospiraceae bacterium]|nr:epoxyqueuosine reductase QueH [Oscillospiraceae bacterium]